MFKGLFFMPGNKTLGLFGSFISECVFTLVLLKDPASAPRSVFDYDSSLSAFCGTRDLAKANC